MATPRILAVGLIFEAVSPPRQLHTEMKCTYSVYQSGVQLKAYILTHQINQYGCGYCYKMRG